MAVTMSFCFFILQMPSYNLFSCASITQIQLLSRILKQHFIGFEVLKVQNKCGNIELFLTQVS